MLKRSVCGLLLAPVILAALSASGCRSSTPPLTDKAESVLSVFLDSWARGETLDKFADPKQPIQGSDPDWKAGYRLLSFLSERSKPSEDSPQLVRCRVALSLQDPKGNKVDKKVEYDVQMGDHTVITRVNH